MVKITTQAQSRHNSLKSEVKAENRQITLQSQNTLQALDIK